MALVSSVRSFNPGATASLDMGLIVEAKDVYWNYVMNILKNVKIPDTSFHNGYIHGNSFFVKQSSDNVHITTNAAKNGVTLQVNDLAAGFHSNDLRYKWSIFVAHARVDVTMSQVNVGMTLGLSEQTLPNGKVVPGFTVSGVNVHIPSDHLHISIHGNYAAQIAKAFEGLFKSTIVHTIEKQLVSTLNSELPKALDDVLKQQNGFTEIYNNMDLDWSIPFAPKVTDKDMEFAIKGLFFKKNSPEVEPSQKAPSGMPLIDPASSSKFQAYVSTYLLESLSSTFLETNEIHFWTKSTDVPKDFPIQLNTTSIGQFIPGLVDKYGPNKPIDIEYNLEKVGNFSIRQDDSTMSFDGSVDVKFWVETEPTKKEDAMTLTMTTNHFNFTVQIPKGSLNVTVNIKEVALGNIHITSTFGNVDLQSLTNLLNEGITIGLPFLNIYLQTLKIRIPTTLFGGLFTLSDLTLKYRNSFLEAGLTPHFLPPKENIPGIYEKFVPLTFADFYPDEDYKPFTTFIVEEIYPDGRHEVFYTNDFSYAALVWEHFRLMLQEYQAFYF